LIGNVLKKNGHPLSVFKLLAENTPNAFQRAGGDLDLVADAGFSAFLAQLNVPIALASLDLRDERPANWNRPVAMADHASYSPCILDEVKLGGVIKIDECIAWKERSGAAAFQVFWMIRQDSFLLEETLNKGFLLGLGVNDEPAFHDKNEKTI
jgi:hypothetical protein